MKEEKLSKKQVGAMLKEALQPFCYEKDWYIRASMTEPFRQADPDGRDCVMASDGHVLICIKAKEAGVAVGGFRKMDDFNAHKVIPTVGLAHRMDTRVVRRADMRQVLDQMEQHEAETKQVAVASVGGIQLVIDGLSHLERLMAFCGAEQALLVWHEQDKVMLEMQNAKGQAAVTVLQMGSKPDDCRVFTLPDYDDDDRHDIRIDWQRGSEAWAEAKAKLEREQEAERMARREVYLVQVVKRAYIPVYAKNADEAQRLADKVFFDPEDDGDDEWMLGSEVPEAEDVDDLDDCYEHVITRDGVVHRDEIHDLDQISEEWEKKQSNNQ